MEFAKNRGIAEFSEMDECLVLALFVCLFVCFKAHLGQKL
jgi:hypothetical protein